MSLYYRMDIPSTFSLNDLVAKYFLINVVIVIASLLPTSSVVLIKTPIEIQYTCLQVCRYIRVDVGRTYRPTRVFASSLRTELSNQSTIQRNKVTKVSRRHTQRRK